MSGPREIFPRRRATTTLVCVLILACTGCASTSPLAGEKFDQGTGATMTYARTPLLLYRDVGSAAAYAREFVNIGPMLINRAGDRRYYLWLGAWTTNTPDRFSASRSNFESVVLLVDGEPMVLDIAGRLPADIGISEPAYIKPVATTADAYYRVTEDQVRLMAQASDLRLLVGGDIDREYGLWNRQRAAWDGLSEFVALAAL